MAKRKPVEDGEVAALKSKISEFFSDTSRSQRETLSGLMELRDEIQMHIEAIEDDLRSSHG